MKKLLFFFVCGMLAVTTKAQQSTSILFQQPRIQIPNAMPVSRTEMDKMHQSAVERFYSNKPAQKTTSGTFSEWYDQWNQNYTSGTSVGYYWATFPDSNVQDVTSTAYYMFTHGMGQSFDPTDSSFWSSAVNAGACVIPVAAPMPLMNQVYTIDSFYAPIKYYRNDPITTTVDSLIIELVVASNYATDSGAYNLQFTTATTGFAPMAYDERPRFSTIHYNSGMRAGYNVNPYINDCYFDSVWAPRQRYAFVLNSTTVADTDANGLLLLGMLPCQKLNNAASGAYSPVASLYSLPISPVTIDMNTTNPAPHLVAYISFKSGHAGNTYPLGTPSTSANWMKLFAGTPLGVGSWFMQNSTDGGSYRGSYQQALTVYRVQRYTDTFFTFPHGTHDVLMPACDFTASSFCVTEEAFHITWTGAITAISNVNSGVKTVKVYPNPANNELNITFEAAPNATVMLTNMVGQVVATQKASDGIATFNTSALPAGMYAYTILSNGDRATGHVVITH